MYSIINVLTIYFTVGYHITKLHLFVCPPICMQDIKAVFDIGNGYVKWVVFWEEDWFTTVLVKDIVKTEWMRKWKILDSVKLSKSILDMSEKFIKKLWGDFIDEVVVWISHPHMERERITEHKRIISWTIVENDVNHLSKLMTDIWQKDNFETIKILPIYWVIDEGKKEKDPIGLQAKKLWLIADIFRVPRTFYNQIVDIFEKLSLQIVDIVPNILATSEAVLDFDQRDLWTLVIDIGTNQTSYAIFEDWHPLYFETIALGSEDVTKDISIWMKVDIKEAEMLKVTNWQVLAQWFEPLPSDAEIDNLFLAQIITARYEEIFEKIQKKLLELSKDWRLAWWVIVSWWWAKIPWLLELTKDIFKLASFEAKEKKLQISDLSKNKQFINTLGLYSRNQQYGSEAKKGFSLDFSAFGKIWKFIKDLF